MFLNSNGTVAKRLHKGKDGDSYKLANQALYPNHERSEAIHRLELCRVYKSRIRIHSTSGVQTGYIRHVELDGEKFPKLFVYKNSTSGHSIAFPIAKIEYSNQYFDPHILYERNI